MGITLPKTKIVCTIGPVSGATVKYDHWLNATQIARLFPVGLQMNLSKYSHKLNTMGDIALHIKSLARRLNYMRIVSVEGAYDNGR